MTDDEGGSDEPHSLDEAEELKRARALLRAIGLKDWPSEEELAANVVMVHFCRHAQWFEAVNPDGSAAGPHCGRCGKPRDSEAEGP